MMKLTDLPSDSGITGLPSPAGRASSATGMQPGETGFAATSMMVASDEVLAVARSVAESPPAKVDRRIAALLPQSLVPSSGSLPGEPPEVAPADARPGDAERIARYIDGACMSAADLNELADTDVAMSIGGAIARLRAVTVSRRTEGTDQELLADELLSLCLRYPADVALQALSDAKESARFFPTYAEMVKALEALVRPRFAWRKAVAGWQVQIEHGSHHDDLRRRHDRARRIVRRMMDKRAEGPWLPSDESELQRHDVSLKRLAAELSRLGLQPWPEDRQRTPREVRQEVAEDLHAAARELRNREKEARAASLKGTKAPRGIRACKCHGLTWRSDQPKPGQCISPRCYMAGQTDQAEGGRG